MRQLAGKKTRYRRAHAAPLAGLNSDRADYNGDSDDVDRSICLVACDPIVHRAQTGITDAEEARMVSYDGCVFIATTGCFTGAAFA